MSARRDAGRQRPSAPLSCDSWESRRRLVGARVVAGKAPLLAELAAAAQAASAPDPVIPRGRSILSGGEAWRRAALAVTAETRCDPLQFVGPPAAHVAQPHRSLAYYLAIVSLGARKSEVAAAACVSPRALRYACARWERDRDDPEVDALVARLEAALGVVDPNG